MPHHPTVAAMHAWTDTGAAFGCRYDGWVPRGSGLILLLEHGGILELTRRGLDLSGWAGYPPGAILQRLSDDLVVIFLTPEDLPPAPVLRGRPPLARAPVRGRA
jgi:hypothetical protein